MREVVGVDLRRVPSGPRRAGGAATCITVQTLAACRYAAEVVAARCGPEDAAAYRDWLLHIAAVVAGRGAQGWPGDVRARGRVGLAESRFLYALGGVLRPDCGPVSLKQRRGASDRPRAGVRGADAVGVGPWPGPWPDDRRTTPCCSPRATGATWSTGTGTGGSRRSWPTSTPAGTTSTSRSRTGSTTSTSAPSSVPPTPSSPRPCTSSVGGGGTAGAPWSPTGTSTCTTTPIPAELVAWAARGRTWSLVGVDNLPGAVPIETVDLPRRCVLLFGQEGPGLSDAARAAATLVCSIAQYGSTRSINAGVASGIAMHTWIRQHAAPPPPTGA